MGFFNPSLHTKKGNFKNSPIRISSHLKRPYRSYLCQKTPHWLSRAEDICCASIKHLISARLQLRINSSGYSRNFWIIPLVLPSHTQAQGREKKKKIKKFTLFLVEWTPSTVDEDLVVCWISALCSTSCRPLCSKPPLFNNSVAEPHRKNRRPPLSSSLPPQNRLSPLLHVWKFVRVWGSGHNAQGQQKHVQPEDP